MKRILLLVTVALMLAAALALSGVAQAQSVPEPPCDFNFCLDKTATPNPATVGEPITFTISERCVSPFGCFDPFPLVDEVPSGLTVDSVDPAAVCSASGNTVTCGARSSSQTAPFTLTIVATPTECGTFTNTASHGGAASGTATATFTVNCVPTTKEQCKKGGWKKFDYPDQGTCVSDVNRRNRQ